MDLNAKGNDGLTPLCSAVAGCKKKIIELLIAKGADVNAKSIHEFTPLHSAVEDGRTIITELLITRVADVNSINEEGETPLNLAEDKKLADLLRKHGGKTSEELKTGGK